MNQSTNPSQEGGTGVLPPGTTLVVRGGDLYDATANRFVRADVAVGGGKVLRIAPALPAVPGVRTIDASGLIVTPGLVDCHVHAFPWGHIIGLDVDPVSSRTGVTTFVEGGSTGSLHFLAFRKFVAERARSNLFALLNVSAMGEMMDGIRGLDLMDHDDLRTLHLPSAVETVERNRDLIVGIKVRAYTGLQSLLPLAAARELADEVGLPLVVHLAPPPPAFRDVLAYLRPGDFVTHIYHPGPGAVVDRQGRLRPEYLEARERGVLIDTGTARFHTSLPVARAAIAQGFLPHTISTDLTANNARHITIDLPTTMSKFLALGLSLADVLERTTAAPARLLLPGRGVGQLVEGGPADLAVFALEEGDFTYEDYFGNRLEAKQRLVNRVTIKDGEVLVPEPSSLPTMELDFTRK